MLNPVGAAFRLVARRLARLGIIDEQRGERIGDLAWPRFLTMFARYLNKVADVAMVGVAVGPAAIAGLAFAFIYWGLANSLSLGLAGGTISQVSQHFGAERHDRLELAVKQSVWLGVLLALPFIAVYGLFPEALVSLVGNDDTTIGLGASYLQVLSFGLLFNALNLVASRTLAGADDTWIAMSIRATGAFTNILLNAIFIFGFGLGVRGAALGTVLAEGLITASFVIGFVAGGLPIVGSFPVTLSLDRPHFDVGLTEHLVQISLPLMGQKLARSFARFPLFALLALFGPTVVAAFEVARRIRSLLRSTGNGFSMSASSLVGQALGRDDELAADAYASDVIRFSAVIYVTAAALVVLAARPLAGVFTSDPDAIATTVPFIRVAAVSFAALGMDYTFAGILKAAGDNRWSMYGRFVGKYLALLPLTYLGTVTPLGLGGVYLAMILETVSSAAITGRRFASGEWKAISRAHRAETADD